MRFLRVLCCLLVAGFMCAQDAPKDRTVRILVLDALNGKPQANVEIEYFCTGLPLNSPHRKATTNGEGLAVATYECNEKQRIELAVFPSDRKEQCGGGEFLTYEEIMMRGLLTDPAAAGNIWCPTKVSKKLKPVPGQITIFVKKPTWWQSHVAG